MINLKYVYFFLPWYFSTHYFCLQTLCVPVCVCVYMQNINTGKLRTPNIKRYGRAGLPCSSNSKESAYDAGDQGLIPGLGSSSGEGNAVHSSILAWRIPWTERLCELWSMGPQRVRCDRAINTTTQRTIENIYFQEKKTTSQSMLKMRQ